MAKDEFEYQRTHKDDLETFFSEPSKDNLPSVLSAEKEYDYLDFKSEWHEKSKLARHILAFSNSGGGAIVIGVEEKEDGRLQSTGIEEPLDDAAFGDKVEKYLPDKAHNNYALESFRYGDVYPENIANKKFQVLFIDGAGKNSPFVAMNSGSSINEGSVYVRRNTKSEEANYDEIQELLKRRGEGNLEKKTAKLHEELRELKTLYSEVDENLTVPSTSMFGGITKAIANMPFESKKNPNHPEKGYEEYVSELIARKKIRIERRIGVSKIEL